jgi:hypothetical protein
MSATVVRRAFAMALDALADDLVVIHAGNDTTKQWATRTW